MSKRKQSKAKVEKPAREEHVKGSRREKAGGFLEKLSFSRLLHNNRFVMAFSIVCAIALWFIMVFVVYPEETRTFSNVRLEIEFSDSQIERGFTVVGEPVIESITVSGGRFDIASLKEGDIRAVVSSTSVSTVESAGTYNFSFKVSTPSGVNVSRTTPNDTISVKIDRICEETFTVSIPQDVVTAAEGYVIESPKSELSEISVTGSSSLIDRIDRVMVVPKPLSSIKSTTTVTGQVEILDAQGNSIGGVTPEVTEMEILYQVFKKKTVPLVVEFTDVPPAYRSADIPYTVTPPEIELLGQPSVIDATDKLVVGKISFRDIRPGMTSAFAIESALPEGITNNTSTFTRATAAIDTESLTERTVTISKFRAVNAPQGKSVVPVPDQVLEEVSIVGPASVLDEFFKTHREEDLVGVIDLDGKSLSSGNTTVYLNYIEVEGSGSCWVTGEEKQCPVSVMVTSS